jgi:hypothetical protein
MLGRVSIGGQDAGVILVYRPGKTLRVEDLARELGPSARDGMQIHMESDVIAPHEGNVTFVVSGGSPDGDIHVALDTPSALRGVASLGRRNGTNKSVPAGLAQGPNRITFEMSFKFKDATLQVLQDGQPLTMTPSAQWRAKVEGEGGRRVDVSR